MTTLPRPREDLGGFKAYRTQQMKADVRLQANEWAEPNRAGQWLTPEELNEVLLNRYPAAGKLQPSDIVDSSFIDELERSGYFQRLYSGSARGRSG